MKKDARVYDSNLKTLYSVVISYVRRVPRGNLSWFDTYKDTIRPKLPIGYQESNDHEKRMKLCCAWEAHVT